MNPKVHLAVEVSTLKQVSESFKNISRNGQIKAAKRNVLSIQESPSSYYDLTSVQKGFNGIHDVLLL